jgi:hypothetical protein
MPHPLPLVPRGLPECLDSLPYDQLARQTGFVRRDRGKITAAGFLKTACLFGLTSSTSLSAFAQLWASLYGDTLSKQAVAKRFSAAAVAFLEAVLGLVVASFLERSSRTASLPAAFQRILVQDSTTLALPERLAPLFPGPSNQSRATCSSLKIQAVLELRSNRWVRFKITPFTCNDQAASPDLLDELAAGDLVIRDLGYLSLEVFRRIDSCAAFFLSRWRHGVLVTLPGSSLPTDLLRLLRGRALWDGPVLLGEARLAGRLVAIRLPEHIAAERRRKARANRDKRLAHAPGYYELLGWNIFITNVPEATANAEVLLRLYALRWRIETVFKAWKSHFHLGQFTDASAEQILVVVLGKLIWISWFTTHFNALIVDGLKISILKLAQWWSSHAPRVFTAGPADLESLSRSIRYYCRYERRRGRRNYLEQLDTALG